MKVTVENKKGLNKDIKVFVDKKTMVFYMDQKYDEIKKTVNLIRKTAKLEVIGIK